MMQRHGMSLARVFIVLFALGFAGSAAAQASGYPSRPIKIIVPNVPGGPNDFLSRMVGVKLSEFWGQPVVAENRGGAGGTIGVDLGAKAAPDGYTIVMGGSSTLAVAPGLYAKLPYDPLRDLAPVANVASVPYVLAVNANVPVTTVRELIELARAKKGSLSYGSGGIGSMSNLATELLKAMTGADLLQVPYKGAAPILAAMVSGEIDAAFADLAVVAPYAKAGKVRLLATSGNRRAAAAPQLPTIAEAGIEGYSVDIWYGLVAPTGTPGDIIDKLSSGVANALKAADVRQRFDQLGYTAIGDTPEQFGATIRADIEKFGRIIKSANIRPQ
jgi:tripartite-type tricarboxylate transporter receptor subunit TctC